VALKTSRIASNNLISSFTGLTKQGGIICTKAGENGGRSLSKLQEKMMLCEFFKKPYAGVPWLG
jgi:hypothetical protein